MLEDENVFFISLPRGVKRTVEATRKPSISPTTTMQAMTEPNRHQLITRMTPPTTPITADTARQTAQRRKQTEVKGPPTSDTVALIMWADRKLCWLTVIVQFYGPCHQHEEEKRCKAKSHAKQLCMTERHQERFRAAEHNAVTLHVTVMQPQKQTSRHSTHTSRYITLLEVDINKDLFFRGKHTLSYPQTHIYQISWQRWHIAVMSSDWNKHISASHAMETTWEAGRRHTQQAWYSFT